MTCDLRSPEGTSLRFPKGQVCGYNRHGGRMARLRQRLALQIRGSEQFEKGFDCQSRMVEYAPERPLADLSVIGHNDPGRRLISAHHHVAAALATEYEARTLQGSADLPAGQISRKLGH